ncbi:AMIN domain-containing protein [Alsobacter sp. SYSU M60028]|uniref:AMIN domain-containing protein n=1 Tax=Alsobacter ponti TaxID=2962936 RepID=A0ABT1L8I6_9HYPH|nr:AMIN domain-containing protein [Alsobacter ponti]MCP8937333.1 AMIN domain-containing protein [Alsobacter ponti]
MMPFHRRRLLGPHGLRPGRLARLAGVACAALILAAPAWAATARIAGSEMKGFGRAILRFDDMPKATARVSNGILIVTFDRPVALNADKLPLEMPGYVSVVRVDPDRKGFRAALTRPMRANVMEAGDDLYLDLLPENWTGAPPPLPADVVAQLGRRMREAEEAVRRLTPKAAEPRDLGFRVGRTSGFTRIVFDVPEAVPVRVERRGATADIVFDAPLRLDPAKLKPALPGGVKGVRVEGGAERLRLSLDLAPGVDVVGFRDDGGYGIDLSAAAAAPKAASAPVAVQEPAKPAAAPDAAGAKPGPVSEAGPVETDPPVARAARASSATAAATKEAEGPSAVTTGAPPRAPSPAPTTLAAPAPAADAALSASPSVAAVTDAGAAARLALPFEATTPLAVFEKDGEVWIVAEGVPPMAQLTGAPDEWLGEAKTSRVGRLAVARLPLKRPALVRAAVERGSWVVTLGDGVAGAAAEIGVTRAGERGGASLRADTPELGGVHWLDDPATGERLAVVTMRGAPRRVTRPLAFVEARVLASAQGLVIAAMADDLAVTAGLDEVTIGRPGGLALSMETPEPVAAQPEGEALVVDARRWAEDRKGVVRDNLRRLSEAAADAPVARRAAARLRLARFQLANGFAAEALGTLAVFAADDKDLAGEREMRVLQAVAEAGMERWDDVRQTLAGEAMSRDPEAALWRAVAEARAERWPEAQALFTASAAVLAAYPDDLRARLLPVAAQAALRAGDVAGGERMLASLEAFPADMADRDVTALLAADIQRAKGKTAIADEQLASLEQEARPAVATRAALTRLEMALANPSHDRATMIDRLEVLAMSWRGDAMELETLSLLARLYAEDERWRDAFGVTRLAMKLAPDVEITRRMQDEAAARFESLFLEGKGGSLPKLEALALYFDFKEFTPPGRRGDEMIRRLADRLVELDLLGEAAGLLQHQVDHRLAGAAKANVAATLALIYLSDHEPARAVQAIRDSRMAELPAELRRARAMIEARALSELSRAELALDLIGGEEGPDIERLRADILWQARDWRAAGEQFERIVGDRWQLKEPFDETDRRDVMRAAVSYAMARDPLSMDRLRGKMAAKMADGEDARAFALVTSAGGAGLAEFRDIARRLAQADTLAEFVAAQRRRMQAEDAPPRPSAQGEASASRG